MGGARYLPHTSSSSGLARRRSTESPALSLASHQSQASSSLRLNTGSSGAAHTRRGSRGSRHRSEDLRGCSSRPRSPLPSPGTPLYTKDLGISEAGKAPTQDASDSEDYLRNKLLRSASEEGLNIPSTPEFSFDGNLSNSPFPVLDRRGSRIVSPTSPASESSSYQGSIPGSGRSEQDSYTTHSERSYNGNKEQRKYFGTGLSEGSRNSTREDLEEALLRTGYFLPEYKH